MANVFTRIVIAAKDEASWVFDSVGNKAKLVAGAIAGYFGFRLFENVTDSAANFEAAMDRVQAATGATGDELKTLRDAAEETGKTTKFTSTEAADALEGLGKAGLSAAQSIEALPGVLALAQAGGTGLAQAADTIVQSINGMGDGFDQAGRYADVLAKGANASNASVQGLSEGLSYAAPNAAALGLSLEDTVAYLGKFNDAGILAGRAGTSLNAILGQFQDPASQFRKALFEAGITTTDFNQAIVQLAAAGPKGEAAIRAVGLEAGPALRGLLNQGVDSLARLRTELENAEGSAAATAATIGGNLNGALAKFNAIWDSVKTALGTPVLPALTDGVNKLSSAFKTALDDGTIAKFGQTIADTFRAGQKWVEEFIAKMDMDSVKQSLGEFSAQASQVMDSVAAKFKTAGDVWDAAAGTMKAGFQAVEYTVFALATAASTAFSAILSGLADLATSASKVTFGDLSAGFLRAAEEIRLSADATSAVTDQFAQRAGDAFINMSKSAEQARNGYAGIAQAVTGSTPALEQNAAAAQAAAAAQQQLAAQVAANADPLALYGENVVDLNGQCVDLLKTSEDLAVSHGKQAAAATATGADLAALTKEVDAARAAYHNLVAQKAAGLATDEQVAAAWQNLITLTSKLSQQQAQAARETGSSLADLAARVEDARQKYEALRLQKEKGLATDKQVAEAARVLNEVSQQYTQALDAQIRKTQQIADAKAKELDAEAAVLTSKAKYLRVQADIARARNDEVTASKLVAEAMRLEQKAEELNAKAKLEQAKASLAIAEADKARLINSGKATDADLRAADASIKLARANIEVADYAVETAQKIAVLNAQYEANAASANAAADANNNFAGAAQNAGSAAAASNPGRGGGGGGQDGTWQNGNSLDGKWESTGPFGQGQFVTNDELKRRKDEFKRKQQEALDAYLSGESSTLNPYLFSQDEIRQHAADKAKRRAESSGGGGSAGAAMTPNVAPIRYVQVDITDRNGTATGYVDEANESAFLQKIARAKSSAM